MKVRLDFCDFHPGFSKTNNFFYNLLRKRFEIDLCDNPDFLIFSDPGQHVHRVHNCVKIFFCVEDFQPDFTWYDYAFTCHQTDDPRNLRLPYYVLFGTPDLLQKGRDNPEQILASKTKFCCFLASYATRTTRPRYPSGRMRPRRRRATRGRSTTWATMSRPAREKSTIFCGPTNSTWPSRTGQFPSTPPRKLWRRCGRDACPSIGAIRKLPRNLIPKVFSTILIFRATRP